MEEINAIMDDMVLTRTTPSKIIIQVFFYEFGWLRALCYLAQYKLLILLKMRIPYKIKFDIEFDFVKDFYK